MNTNLSRTLTVTILASFMGIALAGCLGATDTPIVRTGEDGKRKIIIAIQPSASATSIQAQASELEAFLENRTGADIEIYIPTNYAGTVYALQFGHADVAFLSAWPAQIAAKTANAEVVLAEKRAVTIGTEARVEPYYNSYYIVKKDSPYTNLTQLAGKRMAYTDPGSTSGFVYPVARLVELGLVPAPAAGKAVDPKTFFGNYVFAGGYAQAYNALMNDQVDVAVIAGDVSASLYQQVLANTTIVETQGPIPSHAVVFSNNFQGTERDTLKAALLELKGEKRDLMRKLVSGIFVEFMERTTEEHVGSLDTALDQTGLKFGVQL